MRYACLTLSAMQKGKKFTQISIVNAERKREEK